MTTEYEIPKGYRKNADGHLVPEAAIKPIDALRDLLVQNIVQNAKVASNELAQLRDDALSEIDDFVGQSASEYGVQLGGNKGNLELISFDGCQKVTRHVADHITFDEQLQIAKELIDRCIIRWSETSDVNLAVVAQDAFQVDKSGKVSTSRVLGLRKHNIDDGEWKKAMEAISNSVTKTGSKVYVRIYERKTPQDEWQPVSLNIANVADQKQEVEEPAKKAA
jgi:hypothetical protein